MYKLLLATDQPSVRELFENQLDWAQLGFSKPLIASSPTDAIALLKSKPIDAVGFYLKSTAANPLLVYLQDERASLPIFTVHSHLNKQLDALKDLKSVLNRLHADFADEVYDEASMMAIVAQELTHSLLAGEIANKDVLVRHMQLLRSRVNYDAPCMLFELDMPQGEVYLSNRWHHGQERLENALTANFFNRYAEDVYYGVAVLSNRHIRLVACPLRDSNKDKVALARTATAHVSDAIDQIKEYLDLDIRIAESGLLASLLEFIAQGQERAD